MNDIRKDLAALRRTTVAPARIKNELVDVAERKGLVDVSYAGVDSPFGELIVAATSKGLVYVAYPGDRDPLDYIARWVSPRLMENPNKMEKARREFDRYFDGRLKDFTLPVDWTFARGFAGRVLKATAKVPFGRVTTYRDVAKAAGNIKATRAAGNALGSNPIPIVVPCHRVLRTGGGLGGYRGGLDRKMLLLELEGYEATGR
jgi:methylated-DNA-[protein]-cysteine S-methyltransferase